MGLNYYVRRKGKEKERKKCRFSLAKVVWETQHLVMSRCCQAKDPDGSEMYQNARSMREVVVFAHERKPIVCL